MNSKYDLNFLFIIFLALLLIGCQGNPTVPASEPEITPVISELNSQNHQCLGFYGLVIDKAGPSAELVQLRTADLHLNLTGIFNAFNSVGIVLQPGLSDVPHGLIVVDMSLTHPFPLNPEFSAFDMKAIIYSAGTLAVDTVVLSDADEPRMENADGWTRWWNPTEFTQTGPFGYIESKIPHSPVEELTATVNPYKLFADVLGLEDTLGPVANEPMGNPNGRAILNAGSTSTRRMELRFPMSPAPMVIYGIGIDCSWDEPVPNPPVFIPGDFPFTANQPEAYRVHVNTPLEILYYDSSLTKGGGFLEIEAFAWDWQGQNVGVIADQITGVTLYSPDMWPGGIPATLVEDNSVFARYTADLTGIAFPTHTRLTQLAVKVESVGGTYDQVGFPAPTAPLASWFVVTLDVPEIECAGDSNNNWSEADELTAATPIFDQICDTGDYNDYFFFDIPANHAVTGDLVMTCNAEGVTLGLYDANLPSPGLIQEVTVTGGSGSIPVGEMMLYPATYYIWIHNSGNETVPYRLELTGEIVDTTPLSPVDVTPDGLFMQPWKVFEHDNYLYAISNNSFTTNDYIWIYDVTNPSSPVLVHTEPYDVPLIPTSCFSWPDLFVGYTDGVDCWIDYIDFSNPMAPVIDYKITQVADAGVAPNLVGRPVADDNYLYIAATDIGVDWWVFAFDRSDYTTFNYYANGAPANYPFYLDLIDVDIYTNTYLVGTEVLGDHVLTFDVTDPIVNVPLVDSDMFGGGLEITDMKVNGATFWVVGNNGAVGMAVVADVDAGGNLIGIPGGQLAVVLGAWSIKLDTLNNRGYICDIFGGLTVFDMNIPVSVLGTGQFFRSQFASQMDLVEPNIIYATQPGWGFNVVDVSDFNNIQSLYHTSVLNNPYAVVTDGDIMYALDAAGSTTEAAVIKTIDISDPANAHVIAEYWLDDVTDRPIALDGDLLAVTMEEGWRLLDVSDPTSLTTLYSRTIPGEPHYTLNFHDNYLYVARQDSIAVTNIVEAYDITNPASPVAPPPATFVNTAFPARDILFSGDYMYINRAASIQNYDLSVDPLSPPLEVNYIPSMGIAFYRMAIQNDMLYVIEDYDLITVDISDPTAFSFEGNVLIPNNAVAQPEYMAIGGLFGFTAASPLAHSFNLWPATAPAHVAQVHDGEYFETRDLHYYDGYLYHAETIGGLHIYELY